jgi:hypothetical protein
MMEQVRLGVIVPSVNTVVENWYPKIVPDGVSARSPPLWRHEAKRQPHPSVARCRDSPALVNHLIYCS